MIPDLIMLRLGELNLKGRNRSRFENTVLRHIKKAAARFTKLTFITEFGRIYIRLSGEPYEEVAAVLKRIFGLESFSPVFTAPLDLQLIRETALRVMKSVSPAPKTFKVAVKRVNKRFPYDTPEMNDLVGGYILHAMEELQVDVRRPDSELRIELREEQALIFSEVVEGAGGFPYGSNGKAMLMLSGGIDSPVAGWLAMRKGLEIEAVHFHSYPYTSERAKQKVADLTEKLSLYGGELKLHFVPFTELQTRLHQAYQDNLSITIMRRMMFRITEKLAERQEALAIVTGESLGQVASQTLPSMNAIGRVVNIPVLQPLIMSDKQTIINIARKIDTYELSILPYEDCCTIFLPPSPSTNPNLKVIENIEGRLEWLERLIEETVQNTETVVIGPHLEDESLQELF